MPLRYKCPRCNKLHANIDKQLLGRKVLCPCGKIIRLGYDPTPPKDSEKPKTGSSESSAESEVIVRLQMMRAEAPELMQQRTAGPAAISARMGPPGTRIVDYEYRPRSFSPSSSGPSDRAPPRDSDVLDLTPIDEGDDLIELRAELQASCKPSYPDAPPEAVKRMSTPAAQPGSSGSGRTPVPDSGSSSKAGGASDSANQLPGLPTSKRTASAKRRKEPQIATAILGARVDHEENWIYRFGPPPAPHYPAEPAFAASARKPSRSPTADPQLGAEIRLVIACMIGLLFGAGLLFSSLYDAWQLDEFIRISGQTMLWLALVLRAVAAGVLTIISGWTVIDTVLRKDAPPGLTLARKTLLGSCAILVATQLFVVTIVSFGSSPYDITSMQSWEILWTLSILAVPAGMIAAVITGVGDPPEVHR